MTSPAFASVRDRIESLLAERDIPSIAIAVAHRGEIVWEAGFGWADIENRVPATEHTMYSLASVSKPITATGIMTLVEAGLVNLDRPIDDYLGTARVTARVGEADQATVRRVTDHTSGLPLHYQFYFDDEPYLPQSREETIGRYAHLFTAPGARYQYSNLGYGLLDHVISEASGLSYAEYMRREVFVKLGLEHTSVDLPPDLLPHQAIRYDGDRAPIPFYGFDHPGASAIYSSAHDLVRFGMFHLKDHLAGQEAILGDAAIDEMQRRGEHAEIGVHGIGWVIADRPDGYRVAMHGGGMPGVSTELTLVPAEDIAVAVLCNAAAWDAVRTVRDVIMTELLPGWTPSADVVPPAGPDPESLSELAGTWSGSVHTYAGEVPIRLEVDADGAVQVQLGAQAPTTLEDASIHEGRLGGTTSGDLGTPDLDRHPDYRLGLALDHRDDELSGAVVAYLDDPRPFALSHWTRLTRSG